MNGFQNRQKRQLGQKPEQFPHLVVRLMPAVYSWYPIEFLLQNGSRLHSKALILLEPEPFDKDGGLTADYRRELIETVRFEAKARGLCMGIVFGLKEAIYVEPDGRLRKKPDLPSCGIIDYNM